MQIAGYLKTSLIEWPGKISSLIFTPGCNFRCPFCHNADLVEPQKQKKVQLLKASEVFKDLCSRKKWIDALAITGGEPTLQEDLAKFLKQVKKAGFLTMLHTNGTRPEVINELIINGLTDYICMDLKGNFDNYSNYTNCSNYLDEVKKSVKLIMKSGVEYEFRTTVVPGLHTKENLIQLAKELKSIVHGSSLPAGKAGFMVQPKWFLQQFQPKNCVDSRFRKIKPYSEEDLKSFQKELQKIIPQTFLRGVED